VSGPLTGIVVADLSRVLAGPYATMLLGDLGAEVIKVERPGVGDDTRAWGPPYTPQGTSTYFAGVNRNKQSRAIDLRSPAGRAEARELALGADIVVENFKPGALERMGLGYEELAAQNPGLIYCSITGFGAGEGRDLPGYDLLVQAMGGLMSITGPAPGEPTKAGVALVDVITGLHATVGILAALRHRDVTGEGQRIEVNLLSSLLSALVNQASAYVGADVIPGILGNAHPSIAPYEVYPTADRPLVIAVGNDGQFAALVAELGAAELSESADFATNPARVAHRAELNARLEQLLATAGADEWQTRLTSVGVPCGPINDLAQAFALAQRLGLDPIADAGGTPTVAHPIRLSKTPASYRSAPPSLPKD
jgi:crotonobetainyl-CoA:carnitine CoA-transferase CaiB-like acyl-CoA transferase